MKSRLSTPEKVSVNKSKVNVTRSSSLVQISNRSATNLFINKNFSALQVYNNLFGNKNPGSHIGDANTHFKSTLRKYNEFSTLIHTKWIKERVKPRVTKREVLKASGDRKSVSSINLKKKLSETEEEKEDEMADAPPPAEEAEGDEPMSPEAPAEAEVPPSAEGPPPPEPEETASSILEAPPTAEDMETAPPSVNEEAPPPDVSAARPESEPKTPTTGLEDIKQQASDANKQMGMGEDKEDISKLLSDSVAEIEKVVTQLEDENCRVCNPELYKEQASKGDQFLVPTNMDREVVRELDATEKQAKATAFIITELKQRVEGLMAKDHMTAKEAKELETMNKELLKQMALFEEKTKLIQALMKMADDQLKTAPKHKEELLPKLVICGVEKNMPKIIICDSQREKGRSRKPADAASPPEPQRRSARRSSDRRRQYSSGAPPLPEGAPPFAPTDMPQIANRLRESYDMQEKLAADNVDLERKRYHLQEELVQRDKCLEGFQRKVCSLQAEMRLVLKENSTLHDKLGKITGKCRQSPDMPCGSGATGVCPADVENRLAAYGQATGVLEKQVETMEGEVRRMQEELQQVRRERLDMERQRMMQLRADKDFSDLDQSVCRSSCQGPCQGPPAPPINPLTMADQQLRELREQYNRLQDDYKGKLTEVAGLRADNELMRRTAADTERLKAELEAKLEEYEGELRKRDKDKSKLMGSKEMMIEQEQQLSVAKQRFREAQDELDELRACVQDQQSQLDDYRNKYLIAQQQVEEQRRQIDIMEMENQRISEQVTIEIQRVKTQFQEKLAELAPLPDILKATQLKLQEEQHLRQISDRNADAVTRELQMYKDKLASVMNQIEKQRNDQQSGEGDRIAMLNKLAGWESKCAELQMMNDKMKTEMARCHEQTLQCEKRMEEKLHEITQLTAQLDNVREESARQVARTKERCETVRRSLQGQISEMERQLAQARASAKAAQKERDDIRHKMTAQIGQLSDSLEESQLRIRNLQGHVNFLKTSYTSVFGGPDPMCPPGPAPAEEETLCGCPY